MEKGYVHVYTGNGKGKTTSALGLTLRAVGAGKKVYIGQFLKTDSYHEIVALRQYLPMVTVEQYGNGRCLITKETAKDCDYEAAKEGLKKATAALLSDEYDIVIIDEINIAMHFHLLEETEVLRLIDQKPIRTELILTGRYASKEMIERADLVSEVCEVKHYYNCGVMARDGIER